MASASGDEQKTSYLATVMQRPRLELARKQVSSGMHKAAMQQLLAEAEGCLECSPRSVVEKQSVAASGDKHDYFSYGPYWWPDPQKEGGLPYIRRDGEVNPQVVGTGTDRTALEEMGAAVETLALAGFISGDKRFCEKSAAYIRTWFLDPATRMNPHLKYAQAIPGICDGRGIGLIETRRLLQVINSVMLLEDSQALTADEQQRIREWFTGYREWFIKSPLGQDESKEHNNHGTWYDVQAASFAWFTGKHELCREITGRALRQRLEKQIQPDGSQPHELVRTRSFTYSLINLSGFFALAELGELCGIDFWKFPSAETSLLKNAVAFMGKYADEKTPWPYKQITPLDRNMLYPFLLEALERTGATAYETMLQKLPQGESVRNRSNILRPVVQIP